MGSDPKHAKVETNGTKPGWCSRRRCRLEEAAFTVAVLYGANFLHAKNLERAVLLDARYDRETTWPRDYEEEGKPCTPDLKCFDPKREHWHHA